MPARRCWTTCKALIAATRSGQWFVEGLSPRAGIAVLRAAKAHALMDLPRPCRPDDVQAVLVQTAGATACSPCRERAAAPPNR